MRESNREKLGTKIHKWIYYIYSFNLLIFYVFKYFYKNKKKNIQRFKK